MRIQQPKRQYFQFTAYLATRCAKIRRRDTRQCDSAGILHHRAEPVATTNPDGSYTERGRDVIRQTPFGRMGEVSEELCGTIHYLMSEASRFVTGTVAIVDGGFNAFAM